MKRYIISSANDEIDSLGNIVPKDIAARFANSKIRNRKGQLIVCYHGTNAQFDSFKEEFISTNSGNIGWFGKGYYFTDSLPLAKSYGKIQRMCYLNIERPFVYSSPDSLYELLALDIPVRSYEGRLQPYAYVDDPEPIENFTKSIKDIGYDGVKFSYRQAKYRSNTRGASSASEFVCFYPEQVYFIN